MRTINKQYQDNNDLKEFILHNNIKECENILLQIFTGVCEIEFIEKIIFQIKSLIPHIKIIGSTTSGEIIEDKAVENSTVLSFSLFEKTKIETYYTQFGETSSKTAQKLISQFNKNRSAKVAISFADGLNVNGEEFINTLSSYKDDLIIAGGLAGDNAQFQQTLTFTQEKVLKSGAVVALLFSDYLSVHTTASFGWENIGKTMTITKSEKNRVYEIDGVKAVEIYAKYLGDDIAKNLPKIGIEFPLIIIRKDLRIPRAVLAKYNDGSLVFAGNIHNGDKVTFGYGNVETILSYSNNIKNIFSDNLSESIFVYSCMARKALLQENITLELAPLSKIANVSGFFTYGEFYSNTSTQTKELFNQTMTILGLHEDTNVKTPNRLSSRTSTKNESSTKYIKKNDLTLKALSHLISQTSIELEEINLSLENRVRFEVEKNREKDKAMLQQSKLAQMGSMLAMIAHQWRQPLGAISSSVVNLKLKLELETFELDTQESKEKCNDYFIQRLENIEGYVENLTTTIDDFRNFYKPNKASVTIYLEEVVLKALNIIKTSLESKNIEIVQEYLCKNLVQVYDSELIQVVLNILKNAEDNFLEKGIKNPKIVIKTKNRVISICDNGGGIKKDIVDNIFDPYFSTKDQKNGSGLGLYMSKTIVQEHHNGLLNAINIDNGVCFSIDLRGGLN